MKEDITLTPEQVKAFNKLKAAYKAAEKAGIYFVNCYASLEAYNGQLVNDYQEETSLDEADEDVFPADDFRSHHSIKIPGEWCDDRHLIRLTRKGMKVLAQEE